MIAIGVTDGHAFLRQGQQLRGESIRGVCRAFNTVTKDSGHDCDLLPTGNTRRKRRVLRQRGMQQLENSYLI